MKTPQRLSLRRRGFSLVEVVLALGLVSFCLLAVTGLLPTGLRSVQNANEESAATNALNRIGLAIRNATTEDGMAYSAGGGFEQLTWRLDGAAHTFSDIPINNGGQHDEVEKRFAAHVELVSPASATSAGHARVSLAWPASAKWISGKWIGAAGSVSSGIIFLPR